MIKYSQETKRLPGGSFIVRRIWRTIGDDWTHDSGASNWSAIPPDAAASSSRELCNRLPFPLLLARLALWAAAGMVAAILIVIIIIAIRVVS